MKSDLFGALAKTPSPAAAAAAAAAGRRGRDGILRELASDRQAGRRAPRLFVSVIVINFFVVVNFFLSTIIIIILRELILLPIRLSLSFIPSSPRPLAT